MKKRLLLFLLSLTLGLGVFTPEALAASGEGTEVQPVLSEQGQLSFDFAFTEDELKDFNQGNQGELSTKGLAMPRFSIASSFNRAISKMLGRDVGMLRAPSGNPGEDGQEFKKPDNMSQEAYDMTLPLYLKLDSTTRNGNTLDVNEIVTSGIQFEVEQFSRVTGEKNIFKGNTKDIVTEEGEFKGLIKFKDEQGQPADKVRLRDKAGNLFKYVLKVDNATKYSIRIRKMISAPNSGDGINYIGLEYIVQEIANSTIRVDFKEKDANSGDLVDYSRDKLDQTQGLQAVFKTKVGNNVSATFTLPLFKKNDEAAKKNLGIGDYTEVLRSDYGTQKLIKPENLTTLDRENSLNADDPNAGSRYEIVRTNLASWNSDNYVFLKDTQGNNVSFKVETKYNTRDGGVITFIKQDKVIIPEEPGEGEQPTPVPSTHEEVTFVAGDHGKLKDRQPTRFFVQKGLTWKEAKEEVGTKLTVPTPVPNKDYEFDDWYKQNDQGKADKNAKGLPTDTTTVSTATYQAEFTTKDTVVEVTPKNPEDEPELPKKPNPDYNPDEPTSEQEIPDEDYAIVQFKSDDHGFLDANKTIKRKAYAVLKSSTWKEAQDFEKSGKKVMVIPSEETGAALKLTGEKGYTFTKWEPTLPEDTAKISDQTTLIFVAKFEQDIIENPTEPTPGKGYIRVKFEAGEKGSFEQVNEQDQVTSYDVLEKLNKTLGDLQKPVVTPIIGEKHTGWDKEDTLEIKEANATNKVITVTATYESKPGVVDVTPTPPAPGQTPEEPKVPQIDNPKYNPETPGSEEKIDDPDYVLVQFKAGTNGQITGGDKAYAVLKNLTWEQAKAVKANSATKATPLVVPSQFTPETGYGFINWYKENTDPKAYGIPADAETVVAATYIAEFGKDIDDNPDKNKPVPEGYVRVTFDKNHVEAAFLDTIKNVYDVRVGVADVKGSTSANKKYSDLARFKATSESNIKPPTDQRFDAWTKDDAKLTDDSLIEGTSGGSITVKATYTGKDALVAPTIKQAVVDIDQDTEQKVIEVDFGANTPTKGATYALVKADGTPLTTMTNPTAGKQTIEITVVKDQDGKVTGHKINNVDVVDLDGVKVKVTKDYMTERASNELTLDLKGPAIKITKVKDLGGRAVEITGTITDKSRIHWLKYGENVVTVEDDGSFVFKTLKKDDRSYKFDGKDIYANTSLEVGPDTETTYEEITGGKKIAKIAEAFAGQDYVSVTGPANSKVRVFKYNAQGEIVVLADATIAGTQLVSVDLETPLVEGEIIYTAVLENGQLDLERNEAIGIEVAADPFANDRETWPPASGNED